MRPANDSFDSLDGPEWPGLAAAYGSLPVSERSEIAAFAHLQIPLASMVANDPDPAVRASLARNPFIAGTEVHRKLLEDSSADVIRHAAQWHNASLRSLHRGFFRTKNKDTRIALAEAFHARSQLIVWAPLARWRAKKKAAQLSDKMREKYLSRYR